MLAAGRPVRADHVHVEILEDRIERGLMEDGTWIVPRDEQCPRPRDAPRFGIERFDVEPVQRLRHRDEIDAGVRQAARLGGSHRVANPRVRFRGRDLLGRDIGGVNDREMIGERDARLSAAAARVPGGVPTG
jgi:hypothetical protein